MRRRALAAVAALMLLAAAGFAFSVSAETTAPDATQPDVLSTESTASESSGALFATTTAKPTTTTEDWALISPTDEWGFTLYPPPPSRQETTTAVKLSTSTEKPTTTIPTTTKKPATNPTISYNEMHADDHYQGSLPMGRVPTFYVTEKGQSVPTEPPDEGGYDDPDYTTEDEFMAQLFAPEPEPPAQGVNWPIILVAGVLFLIAFTGAMLMLSKNKKSAQEAPEPRDMQPFLPEQEEKKPIDIERFRPKFEEDEDEAPAAEPEEEPEAPTQAEEQAEAEPKEE